MWSHKYDSKTLVNTHSDNICKLLGIQNIIVFGSHGSGVFDAVDDALVKQGIIHNKEWVYKDCSLSNDNKNTLRLLNRQNNQCFEFIINDYGTNERYVIKNILHELSNKYVIDTKLDITYKIIVIHNIEWFSKDSQQVLGIFAEKLSYCTRYIFTTNQTSNLSAKLTSQCFLYRIPRPSVDCIKKHMHSILESENKVCLNDNTIDEIVERNSNHIEDCVNHLQMSVYGVQSSLDNIYDRIINILLSKKLNKIKYIRELVYILLVNNVDCTMLIRSIINRLSSDVQQKAIRYAALYESRLRRCERSVYHVEAFFMHLIKLTDTTPLCKA